MKKDTKIAIAVAGSVVAAAVLVVVFRKQIKKVFGGYKWFDEGLNWYRDEKTRATVNRLHPKAIDDFKEFISRVEKELGLQVIATSGYRSWEKQAELRRLNPKNARAGYSSHNYGFALDVNVMKNNNIVLRKSSSKEAWNKSGVVGIAKKMGFKWGGDFPSYHDPVHFYIEPKGMNTSQLRSLYLAGKRDSRGYVKI